MWAIIKKELKSYFLSPIGYIYIGIFIFITSLLFLVETFYVGSVEFNYMYSWTSLVITFTVPILTMRMFAEEKKTGTDQLLLTSPRSITQIVLGKYIAACAVVLVTMLVQFGYFIILTFFGEPQLASFLVTLLGITLISMAYIAFGMFASSLTESQIIAAVISFVVFFIMLFIPSTSNFLGSLSLASALSNSFLIGTIALRDLVSMITFSIVFILFTIIVIQRRKGTK